MIDMLTDPSLWLAFFTLTALELVLGIDNIIFISILVDKLPPERRVTARRLGLGLAMVMRLGLLFTLAWIVGMKAPLFEIPVWNKPISGRDLVLIAGGVFLLWKSAHEIHHTLELAHEPVGSAVRATFAAVLLQIVVIDAVFSLDSIITAVGMVNEIEVMAAAVVASVGLMMWFAGPIGQFVSQHPSIKMLALSFLVVIGTVLIADGFGHHVPKGYVYSALAFSLMVESLNIVLAQRKAAAKRRLGTTNSKLH